jgi:hypothetical protein
VLCRSTRRKPTPVCTDSGRRKTADSNWRKCAGGTGDSSILLSTSRATRRTELSSTYLTISRTANTWRSFYKTDECVIVLSAKDEIHAFVFQVVYTFSDGRSTTVIKTNDTYNYGDNKWHLIEFSRDENTAKLVLDTSVMYDKQVSNVQKIDIKPPLYVGGLDPVHYNQIQGSLVSFFLVLHKEVVVK